MSPWMPKKTIQVHNPNNQPALRHTICHPVKKHNTKFAPRAQAHTVATAVTVEQLRCPKAHAAGTHCSGARYDAHLDPVLG